MLVVSRKVEEEILIGPDVKVKVLGVRGGVVRLGIDAPREIVVLRSELIDRHGADGLTPPQ